MNETPDDLLQHVKDSAHGFLGAADCALKTAEQAERMLRGVLEALERGDAVNAATQLVEVDTMRQDLAEMRRVIEQQRQAIG